MGGVVERMQARPTRWPAACRASADVTSWDRRDRGKGGISTRKSETPTSWVDVSFLLFLVSPGRNRTTYTRIFKMQVIAMASIIPNSALQQRSRPGCPMLRKRGANEGRRLIDA